MGEYAVLAEDTAVPHQQNRLAREKSPYLLQHAANPVDWYPWGPEAFEKARRENKPVLLSIGYSTCHWCHVMEEESFEDRSTADLLNSHFISVKVDREERADLDNLYMSYVISTTGSGGWPMTVFLTPDKKPFYGGTYFPPEDRYGMPGFKTLLTEMADAWRTRRKEIDASADSAAAFLSRPPAKPTPDAALTAETRAAAFEAFAKQFDAQYGGFGRAPKFPRPHALSFILRHWRRTRDPRALEIVERTLAAMAKGGLNDQLGGGFHRYSTDALWRVPHFEKMLYDQALLAGAYLEAYQATGKTAYADITRSTLDYVLREMTGPEGGFHSAQDADSEDPFRSGKKREGAYFVWKKKEIDRLLGDRAPLFEFLYGVEPGGNAPSDPHGEFAEQNVLFVAHSLEDAAARFGLSAEEARASLEASRAKLLAARASTRTEPHLDDKVLADWNGLMIAALARAAVTLDEPRYRAAAEKAAGFVLGRLKAPDGRLLHRWRAGEAAIPATLNDHAAMALGCLALYEATFDPRWLGEARALTDRTLEFFRDEHGGFFLTASDAEALIARPRELYDGAVPSGNSLAALVLRRLERLTGEARYRRAADEVLEAAARELAAEPTAYPAMLMAFDHALGPSEEIVLAGDPAAPALKELLAALREGFHPDRTVLLRPPGAAGEALDALAPAAKGKAPQGALAAAYVCRASVCAAPVTDAGSLRKALDFRVKEA